MSLAAVRAKLVEARDGQYPSVVAKVDIALAAVDAMAGALPAVTTELVTPSRWHIVVGTLMSVRERYARGTSTLIVPRDKATPVKFWILDLGAGGVQQRIYGAHTLVIDGRDVQTLTGAGETVLTFTIPAGLRPGWQTIAVRCELDGYARPTAHFHVGTQAVDTHIPRQIDTYHAQHELGDYRYNADGSRTKPYGHANRWCWVPVTGKPVPVADEQHPSTPFSHVPNIYNGELWLRARVPECGELAIFRTREGVLTADTAMAYPYGHMVKKYPVGPQRDGPRGVGCISFVSGAAIGKFARIFDPTNKFSGNDYVWNMHRFCVMRPDGYLQTRFGFVDADDHPVYHGDSQEVPSARRFIGRWREDVPEVRRHIARMWGGAWVPQSLQINPDGPKPAEPPGDRPPHFGPPTWLFANGWTGSICRVEFDNGTEGTHPEAHGIPPLISEFWTGLDNPFGLAISQKRREVYVAETGKDRIVAKHLDTGAVRVILEAPRSTRRDPESHILALTVSLLYARQHPVSGPEGMAWIDEDAGDLVFVSVATQQVTKVNVDTLAWQHLFRWTGVQPDGRAPFSGRQSNDHFSLVQVSDGSFYPKGTIFVSFFGAVNGTLPTIWVPQADGTYKFYWLSIPSGTAQLHVGRGPNWNDRDYAGGFDVGEGRMIAGSSKYGVREITLALPTDPRPPSGGAAIKAYGESQDRLLQSLVLTADGCSPFGYPLP
jgi:hypothetical protein